MTVDSKTLHSRIRAALGTDPCDLVFRNARFLDVFSGKWNEADIGVLGDTIVAVDPGVQGKRVVEMNGRSVVPGFIDAHVHVESSLLIPSSFEKMVLPRGTTSAVCDPHELANVQGVTGIEYFLNAAETLSLDLWVMLSSCVPATNMETNGGGKVTASDLTPLRRFSKALGLAEMMNVPGVLGGDPEVLEKLEAFGDLPMDGHCPLVRGRELSAYAAAGIRSCHESTQLEEAREKLTKGLAVWIREGSVAKDLDALIPLLDPMSSVAIGFCTDDRNPLDIAREGHLDYLIRRAIQSGVTPEVAYRSASHTVARHYGLHRQGAIAPGFQADLVVLEDVATCVVGEVLSRGKLVSEMAWPSVGETSYPNTIQAVIPQAEELRGPSGRVHVIGVREGQILTDHLVQDAEDPGVCHLSVLERYGKGGKPANAFVHGFGDSFRGAIASSVGHDSHNLIAVGSDVEDMKVAWESLKECGGGFVVVKDGQVLARLALPFGGLMSAREESALTADLIALRKASAATGCQLKEPFLQLAFLSLPVIPSLKLTDQGLVDVEAFGFIDVKAG